MVFKPQIVGSNAELRDPVRSKNRTSVDRVKAQATGFNDRITEGVTNEDRARFLASVRMGMKQNGNSDSGESSLNERIMARLLSEDLFATTEGGIFIDAKFNTKINLILDTIDSLENQRPNKDKIDIWSKKRVEHGIDLMTDKNLKTVVMETPINLLHTKPEYFTAVCGEIMERVLGNIDRIIDDSE